MKEKITLDGDKDQDFLKFGEIVLEKNPNVFIGTLKEYEKLKKDLAKKHADNRKMYTASKNDFIQSVLKAAEKSV